MARTVKPGKPEEIKAQQFKVTTPDFSAFEEAGDAEIKAANQNFKLYADLLAKRTSNKAFEQFKDDPIQLSNALGKLPDMFSDLPEEVQKEIQKKLYLNNLSLVQKAHNNQIKNQDKQNKAMADENVAANKEDIALAYANVLQNQAASSEDKQPVVNDIFLQQASELKDLADLKSSTGTDAYTAPERDNIANISAVQLSSSKQFFEDMLANDNDNLDRSREYLKDITENPVSFKNQTYMPDNVYDAYRSYIEQRIEQQQNLINNRRKIDNYLAFMDNPIIHRAKLDRAFGEEGGAFSTDTADVNQKLDEKAREMYSLADKVGDGKVDPATLALVVRQVASVTVDDTDPSIVDDNLLKAFSANYALRKAGADSEQMAAFNKLVQIAMTDTTFKQSVAALAGKPDFNNMFLNKRGRSSFWRSAKDEDTTYVENLGREAYLGAMERLTADPENPQEALAYYDQKVAQAYDFIKKDVIDVDYVKNSLAKMGYAMVDLNGRMTKITGRLPNGEYIIESTGDTINGTI